MKQTPYCVINVCSKFIYIAIVLVEIVGVRNLRNSMETCL